jgi:erythromycin esterase
MRSSSLAARVAACITIAVAGLGSGAAVALASDPAPSHPLGGASPTVAEWVDRHAHPLATTDPADPVGDLRPLGRIAAGASVVGLGEATHGSHEQFRVKHRMVRFLVERMGFRTVAFEGDFASGVLIDRYVVTGEGDPRALIAGMQFPFWNAEEIVDLVEWMRAYNQRHADDVRFLGTDVLQLRQPSFDAIRAHVGRVAPDRLAELDAYLSQLALRGSNYAQMTWYNALPEAEQQRLIDTAGDLVSFLTGLPAAGDRLEHEYAVQHARAIHGWYEYYEELEDFRPTRAHDIAETTLWWRGLTGHRIAFWAASAHVTSASELTYRDPAPQHGTMAGGLLERRLGQRYVAIGTLFHQGTISSDYSQPGPHRIGPTGPGLLESTLVAASSPAYVLPLPSRAPGVVGDWLAGEATMRMIHPAYREGEDPDAYTMTVPSLREAFDALVFVRHTTASRLIGR